MILRGSTTQPLRDDDGRLIAWRWPHIHPVREWACKGTGLIVVETAFLDRVERLRERLGRPLIITSGYRSPAYNARVSSSGLTGPHTTGRALDVRVFGTVAYDVLALAIAEGFTGLGVSQRSATPHGGRFLHLDDLPNGVHPRPWVWGY